jgi:uncharacterized membrane protein
MKFAETIRQYFTDPRYSTRKHPDWLIVFGLILAVSAGYATYMVFSSSRELTMEYRNSIYLGFGWYCPQLIPPIIALFGLLFILIGTVRLIKKK